MRILAQYPEMISNPARLWVCLAVFAITIIIVAVTVELEYKSGRWVMCYVIESVLILFLAFSPIIIPPEIESSHVLYDIAVDETIGHEAIFEKYDVIEHRGDLFIIRDYEKP